MLQKICGGLVLCVLVLAVAAAAGGAEPVSSSPPGLGDEYPPGREVLMVRHQLGLSTSLGPSTNPEVRVLEVSPDLKAIETKAETRYCRDIQKPRNVALAGGYLFSDRRQHLVHLTACREWRFAVLDPATGEEVFVRTLLDGRPVDDRYRGIGPSLAMADLDGYNDVPGLLAAPAEERGRRDEAALVLPGDEALHVLRLLGRTACETRAELPDAGTFSGRPDPQRPIKPGVQVAADDFDGDGRNEIAVAYLTGPQGGGLTVATYRFHRQATRCPGRDRLQRLAVYRSADLGVSRGGFSVAAGDFDGDGRSELAVAASHRRGGKTGVWTHLFRFDDEVVPKPFATVERLGSRDLPNIPAEVAALRLRYDPQNGYGFGRQQLMGTSPVTGWFAIDPSSSGDVVVQELAFDQLDDAAEDALAGEQLFDVALAAGSFQPVERATTEQVVGAFADSRGTNVVLMSAWYDPAQKRYLPKIHAIRQLPRPRQLPAGLALATYDGTGSGLRLGSPLRIELSELITLDAVIEEPPKHIAYLPQDPESNAQGILNVSRRRDFAVELGERAGRRAESVRRSHSEIAFGAGVGFELKRVDEVAGGGYQAGLRRQSSRSTDERRSRADSRYESIDTSLKGATDSDDLLRGRISNVVIWRYPIVSRPIRPRGGGEEVRPYLDVVLPDREPMRFQGGGRHYEWYQPMHENGNVLSYPVWTGRGRERDYGLPDVGPIQLPGEPKPVKGFLVHPLELAWDGTSARQEFAWDRAVSKSSEFTSRTELKVDREAWGAVKFGLKGSVGAKGVSVDVESSTTLKAAAQSNFRHVWGSTTTDTTTTTSGFSVRLDKPAGASRYGYSFYPLLYKAQSGAIKQVFQVGALSSDWWRRTYKLPDLALNMPWRYLESRDDFTPGLERTRARGVTLRTAVPGLPAEQQAPVTRAPAGGEKVTVEARVGNFSVQRVESRFAVAFSAVAIDPLTGREIGDRRPLGRAEAAPLAGRAQTTVRTVWDTTGFAPPRGVRPYRLYVTLDPDEAIDELNRLWMEDPERRGRQIRNPAQNNEAWISACVATPEAVAAGPVDVRLGADALVPLDATGEPAAAEVARVTAGEELHLRVRLDADGAEAESLWVALFEEDPANPEAPAVAMRRVPCVDGERGGAATLAWFADEPGERELFVRVLEAADDPRPGNAVDALRVVVEPAEGEPAG